MATVRRVRMRHVEVIDCGDAETADKVESLLGAKVRRISPTMFEVLGGTASSRAALVKRLRTGGVFVGESM